MSNPYRVRQTRARADASLAGYVIQNQKPWNPGSDQRPPNVDVNAVFQQPPPPHPPLTNQRKTINDSWDWNVDSGHNGNDSWNWSIEQATQPQAQHHQSASPQQQQQQTAAPSPSVNQFIPYPNQKQSIPLSAPDNYYKSLNGNNRPPPPSLNQHDSSGKETPRSISSVKEPTPKQLDSFPQYANYNHNQQLPVPSRPSSNVPYSGPVNQHQWSTEQQNQNLYAAPNVVHNQVQKPSSHPIPPPPTITSVNNYNWNNSDQQNVSMQNWQNHAENSTQGYWQEPSLPKQEQYSDNKISSWPQVNLQSALHQHQTQQRIPNAYLPSSTNISEQTKYFTPHETSLRECSTTVQNWLPSNALTCNQWSKNNSENVTNVLPRQQSLPSNTWSPEDSNSVQPWQQSYTASNIPSSQWRQPKLQPGGSLEESALSENNKGEWQQIHALPSHFNSSTTSTTSGSLANMSSSTEQLEDRKRSLTPTTSCASLNEFQSQTSNPNQASAENNSITAGENFNSQSNVDLDWNNDGDWNTVTEISSGVSNINLGKKFNQPADNSLGHKEEQSAAHVNTDWSRQAVSGIKSEQVGNTPDKIPILSQEHNSVESPAVVPQEQLDVPQESSQKPAENVSQVNYDQWYKQNVRTQSDNEFFSNDLTQQWPIEQNVENYENIQQSSEFVNLEVVAPESQDRDIYGSRESINKETLDNDQVMRQTTTTRESTVRDFRQEMNNVEVPMVKQIQQPLPTEQAPDNYEFASNDRNTFLETGELTDPHSQEHEVIPPNQDDENDEVPNDIPFSREVPGQSSMDPRRNDPTGQEQYAQIRAPLADPRRNDPSGQEQLTQNRASSQIIDRPLDRRDIPSGQERTIPVQPQQQQPQMQQQPPTLQRSNELESVERRNDPSGRERSLPPPPPQQSRNEPSGEEQRTISAAQITGKQTELVAMREILGRDNEPEETIQQSDSGLRQIPGGASSNESVQIMPDDRVTVAATATTARTVARSQQATAPLSLNSTQDQATSDSRIKREGAVGASLTENQMGPPIRRDSYQDGDDESSGNSREGSRDRRRETSPNSRLPRYDYNRRPVYYDRERDFEDDYYYDRRRVAEYERSNNSREDLDRRDGSYRDELDRDRERHVRDDLDRRPRLKEEIDDRDGRRRVDERWQDRSADPRRLDRDGREYDPRYSRDYLERDRRRDDRRSRRYPEYDPRDPREPRDPRDLRGTYRRDYYDESYGRSSRPSSRSSYNDRDRDYYLRSRDPYASYGYNNYAGFDYGSQYNSNYYAYLENLRRTDPAAYTEWYHKYYQHQQQIARGVNTNYPEDRASVHSGRSSCDERNSSEKRNLTDVSLLEDQTAAPSRLTPTKFSTAHAKSSFSIGSLVHVNASYPTEGERARVDILKLDHLLSHDMTLRELRSYPGPLIKGVTHKKIIIDYCENKIKKAPLNDDIFEVSSYVLLYELMIMLIRQNGNLVGVDIASLILRNKEAFPYDVNKPSGEHIRRESMISQRSGASGGGEKNIADSVQLLEKEEHAKPRKTVEQLTDEFRKILLDGMVQNALDFAMAEGLWGHALFLASKLDKRTYASIMTRFANSLPPQDPLQTLYQLHSGRVPASVTCVSDAKWDDWRPHLAMIISNPSMNADINSRSILSLGNTLASRGDIYAAHFCYILSQVEFGAYGSSAVKIVLIGANHHKPYSEFISTEAIMLTEIYEYARKLSEPFTLIELQTFKFNLAVKMVDYGLIEKALLYIEQVATNIANEPEKYKQSFIKDVYVLGDRLKYHDPICKDSDEDVTNLPWLNNLAEIIGKWEKSEIIQDNNHDAPKSVPPAVQAVMDSAVIKYPYTVEEIMEFNKQLRVEVTEMDSRQYYEEYNPDVLVPEQQQQAYDQQDYTNLQYTTNQQQGAENMEQNKWTYESDKTEEKPADKSSTTEYQHQPVQQQQPNISIGPSGGKQYDPLEELEALESSKSQQQPASKSSAPDGDAKKPMDKSADKNKSNAGGSWFGGLFSKLALKPKNQMILPDDNNPSIVWDPVLKKWTNKEEEDGGGAAPLAPPPKMSEIPGFTPAFVSSSALPSSSNSNALAFQQVADESINTSKMITGGGNMYKMSRNRSMRANYVDVMNPGGVKASAGPTKPALSVPTPASSPAMPMATSSPQLFIPAPVNDPNAPVDFLTPAMPTTLQSNENSQELSRWSSASSLSREVQSYTMRDPRLLQRDKGPMMYNPMDLKDQSQKDNQVTRSRYPTAR